METDKVAQCGSRIDLKKQHGATTQILRQLRRRRRQQSSLWSATSIGAALSLTSAIIRLFESGKSYANGGATNYIGSFGSVHAFHSLSLAASTSRTSTLLFGMPQPRFVLNSTLSDPIMSSTIRDDKQEQDIGNDTEPTSSRCTDTQLRRAAGSKSIEQLKQALQGWSKEDIDNMDGKNAVHMAAWQGSLENLRYLVEDVGCDINAIANGEYSYGKTPVFFACTRSRSDIVEYLVKERNANVKIVNNKGQSVRSIASSHFVSSTPDDTSSIDPTLQAIIDAEERQANIPWRNYRATHSDMLVYGDLDPRFLERPITADDYITRHAVNPTTKQSRRGSFYQRNPTLQRSTKRKTYADSIRNEYVLSQSEEQDIDKAWVEIQTLNEKTSIIDALVENKTIEDDILEKIQGMDGMDRMSDAIYIIVKLHDKRKAMWIPTVAEKLRQVWTFWDDKSTSNFLIGIALNKHKACAKDDEEGNRNTSLLQKLAGYLYAENKDVIQLTNMSRPRNNGGTGSEEVDVKALIRANMLSYQSSKNAQQILNQGLWKEATAAVAGLTMGILEQGSSDDSVLKLPADVALINTTEGLAPLQQQLSLGRSVVAIDSEWYRGELSTNIATLQIAIRTKQDDDDIALYIVDALPSDEGYIQKCRSIIQDVFYNHIVLGFAVSNDVPKLERWINAPLSYKNVLDVQHLWKQKMTPGLATCVSLYSTRQLSKKEQRSDWSHRPLNETQVEYAALDAAVLLILLAEKHNYEMNNTEKDDT